MPRSTNSHSTISVAFIMPLRKILLCCISVLSLQFTVSASQQAPGIAVITSTTGQVQITSERTDPIPTQAHTLFEPSQTHIETGPDSTCFLVLSNGAALGIGPISRVQIETYTQAPFPERKESLNYEPSISRLHLKLETGQLALAYAHLSPLSTSQVELTAGQFKLNNGIALLETTERRQTIRLYEGTGTLHTKDGQKPKFLGSKETYLYDDTAASIDTNSCDIRNPDAHLARATEYARQRVLFKSGGDHQRPAPIYLLPTARIEQPSQRPYSFKTP